MATESITLRTRRWIIPTACVMVAGIGGLQVALPFGWTLAALYLGPVGLVALWSSFRHAFLVGAITTICTVLATLIFFGSPFWDSGMSLLTAYMLPVGTMWWVAGLALTRKWAERKAYRAKVERIICTVCKSVWSVEGTTSLEQYGHTHRGSLLSVGLCPACTAKWGALHPGPFQVGA